MLPNLCFCLSLICIAAASYQPVSRNDEVRRRDRIAPLSQLTSINRPQSTAGSAVIEVIQDIQEGVSDLPGNLLKFVQDTQDRLQQFEALLGDLVPASPTTSTSLELPLISKSSSWLPYLTPPAYPTPHNGSYPSTGFAAGPTGTGYGTGYSYCTPPPSPTASDRYDSQATNNVAVHHRVSAKDDNITLSDLCGDPNINIVVLDFVFTFANLSEGWPDIIYGPECSGDYIADREGHRLFDCSALAPQMESCQRSGKKVLLSLGQAVPGTNFTSNEAELLAEQMWSLFGQVNATDDGSRPIGNDVTVDGFEITLNLDNPTLPWDIFVERIKILSYQDYTRQYYLASRPSCNIVNPGIVPRAMALSHFIWPQFYSDPSCQVNSTDNSAFLASFRNWFRFVNEYISPQLYIGLTARQADAAYVPSGNLDLVYILPQFRRGPPPEWPLRLGDRLGGVMVHDGAEAINNVDEYNATWLDWLKAALGGCSPRLDGGNGLSNMWCT